MSTFQSTDADASLLLCDHLKTKGWRATLWSDVSWHCCFYNDSEGLEFTYRADTLPLAITCCFLFATGAATE